MPSDLALRCSCGDRTPAAMLFRVAGMLLMARLRGEQKPSPSFDAGTGQPSVEPRVPSAEELRELTAVRDAGG